jgi:hypothetical protein
VGFLQNFSPKQEFQLNQENKEASKEVNKEQQYSSEDWEEVKKLLKRSPHGLLKVEKYHPTLGHPMVIKVEPWVRGAPFPTLFWMTCPILKKEISHLESAGWVGKLEAEHFTKDSENLNLLKTHHTAYLQERIQAFENSSYEWSDIPEAMEKIIKETGIGGIHDFDHIKCMHLHYGHHLARENQVGKVMDELFDLKRFYKPS